MQKKLLQETCFANVKSSELYIKLLHSTGIQIMSWQQSERSLSSLLPLERVTWLKDCPLPEYFKHTGLARTKRD